MKWLLSLFLISYCFIAQANDSISIKLNKLHFLTGDTISFSCNIANYKTLGLESATMNIWIEDVAKTSMKKFRYPMVNGILPKTKLVISDSMKQGVYAINFVIQKGLFSVVGKIKDNSRSSVNYFVISKNGGSYLNNIPLTKKGEFLTPSIVFDDEATFIFSPVRSKEDNDLFIDVISPLDSMFTPEAVLTQLITVGINEGERKIDVPYEYTGDTAYTKGMLPNVTVTARQKKTVEQFNDKYASFAFKMDDGFARVFDGFEDPQLSRTANLVNFLISRVPGFDRITDDSSHNYIYLLRREGVVIFFNEVRLSDDFDINTINPAEIAMIKVINSPTMLTQMRKESAILIYTKRGNYYDNTNARHNFVFKGYTPEISTWK